MSSTINLLPCPFCNNAEIAINNENPKDNSGGYFIECPGCGASTSLRFACGDDPTSLLAEQWNRRATSHCLHQIQEPAAAEQAAWHAGLDEGRAQAAPEAIEMALPEQALRAAGIEQVARMLQKRADEYADEHLSTDPDTGATEGRDDRIEYWNWLVEMVDDVRALLAGISAPAAQPERKYICPVRTIADLVNNLMLMDQSLPIYGAQYIEHPAGRRRAIAVPPTVSIERVKDSRWIGEGEALNTAIIWTRAEQPAAQAVAMPFEPRPTTDAFLAWWEPYELSEHWFVELHKIARDAWNAALSSPQAQADARDAESDYQRGYRHGYNRRDAEVRGALA